MHQHFGANNGFDLLLLSAEKPLFRDGMYQRRCLIPASHYFEWERTDGQKIKNAIKPAGSEAMYMAGIYRISNGVAEFMILTREPGECIRQIHDRMPVILPKEATTDWLNPKFDALEVLQAAMTERTFVPVDGVRQEQMVYSG